MKLTRQYSRALLVFYVLVIYVLMQFFWWTYLMVDQTKTIYEQQTILAANDAAQLTKLQHALDRKWAMIAGEGSVFLLLMLIGIFQVRKAFRREAQLFTQQKTFLHSVTHEFKSPIASLRLQLETLIKRNLSAEQQQEALNNALEDTERLDYLSEKMLVAARIDNGELPLYRESLNLTEKIKDVIAKVSRSNPGRKIEQNIAENVYSYMDAWAFSSIATNLLENALLYSPAESTVNISLKGDDSSSLLTVKDNGVGIPAEERQKIFQKFYRLNSTIKGTGLGLYLVDYLVKNHKGNITVKENSPQGSIFEVTLPGKKL
jgi:signal transduction histidine kinase